MPITLNNASGVEIGTQNVAETIVTGGAAQIGDHNKMEVTQNNAPVSPLDAMEKAVDESPEVPAPVKDEAKPILAELKRVAALPDAEQEEAGKAPVAALQAFLKAHGKTVGKVALAAFNGAISGGAVGGVLAGVKATLEAVKDGK